MGSSDNESIVLPFSAVFDIKKIEEFNPEDCSIDINMEIIVRIKVTGIAGKEREEILNHIKKKLKVRINEEEMLLLKEDERADLGRLDMIKSKEAEEDGDDDMVQFTKVVDDKLFCHYDCFENYPFD